MNKRILSLMLALAMVLALLPGRSVSASAAETADTKTLDVAYQVAPEYWSAQSWSSDVDGFILQHIQTPLVEVTVKDTEKGEYQYLFLAATAITDVTGTADAKVEGGSVFEISLNPNLCWENGTPITADSYIYSMQHLLDGDNYYINAYDYTEGDLAIAGAEAYNLSGQTLLIDNYETFVIQLEEDLVWTSDGYNTPYGEPLYIPLYEPLSYLSDSLSNYVEAYGSLYFDVDAYNKLLDMADANGWVRLNETSLALLQDVISEPSWGEGPEFFINYIFYSKTYPEADWSTVGLYKTDDYTLHYVTVNPIARNTFLRYIQGMNRLVYEDIYETCKADRSYGTSVNTTMSYGPYKLQSVSAEKAVLVRNEKHFEYTADSKGNLSSQSSVNVDGSRVSQWQMDSIVIHVLGINDAMEKFLAGEIDLFQVPTGGVTTPYANSPALYQANNETTYSLILNADADKLQEMDANYGTTNAAVLSNANLRKAVSLSMKRSGLDMAGNVRKGALGLLNETFYYDVDNNPASVYRKSDEAMEAICDLYEVEYGAGTPYATLREAHESITGYDPVQAKALMAKACDELVAAGLYTRGEPIVLSYAASTASDYMKSTANGIANIINEAAQGSGFGTFTVELRICGNDWAYDIQNSKACMVLAGWTGVAYDPFDHITVYVDHNYHYVPGNIDTSTELLTLNIAGKDYTLTWENWGKALNGEPVEGLNTDILYHNLEALAKLENAYLKLWYMIPLWNNVTNYMVGYQVSYCTDEYNLMYGFGGTRLMSFHYTDAEWEAYVEGGNLSYEEDPCSDGHSYRTSVVEPTCTEQGYTAYSCTLCSHSYMDNYVDALGHNYVDGICTRCGETDPEYVPVLASGWSGATQWTLTSDGTLTVYGSGNMKNYGWTGGQPWEKYAAQITSVVIEEGVTAVGSGAFKDMTALESVTLPATGLNKIGIAAFYGCTSLKEITIPEGIYTIWEYTFKNCSGMEAVNLPKTLIKIDQGAFEACTSLAELYLPTNVNIIGGWSFKGCTALTSVDMQWADAKEIRPGAFKNCTALTEIILPTNIQTLGDSCFYGIGATTFTVPDTVTTIEDWCFARSSLKEIIFEGNAPAIGTGAFNKITLTARYPSGNTTWTANVRLNYGGTVIWKAE